MIRRAWFIGLAAASGVVAGAVGTSMLTADAGRPDVRPAGALRPDTPFRAEARSDTLRALDSANADEVLESLTRVLDDEINERRVLAEKLEALDAELSALQSNLKSRVEEAFQAANEEQRQAEAVSVNMEDRLAEAGITAEHLASIQRVQAEAQMAAIDLDDRARREGWINTPRYYREAEALASGRGAIREALGDELYDRYMFASGMPNRVAVGSIIETSPAEQAGFLPGDVIVSYAGETVWSSQQLIDLRSSGVRGEAVAVRILRDGQPMQLSIPRGPMGMSTAPTLLDPSSPAE